MNEKIGNIIGKVKLGAKRNAPELLLGAGLITGTATVVLASRATIKAKEINDCLKEEKLAMEENLENGLITEEELKVSVKRVYSKYALSLVKEYAIPAGLYASTVALIFSS